MSLNTAPELDAPPTLPRGRHNLPEEVVRASQRERLLRAMLASVAERGYEATTVPQVVADARVSRNAFYELFSDKADCFLALCDELADEILGEVSVTTETDWISAVRSGLARYLRWWQDRPAFCRTYFVEFPASGKRAIEQRARQYARFERLFEAIAAWARAQQPELPPLRPLAARAIVRAVTELIADEVSAGRIKQLTKLESDLVHLIVTLISDSATADRAVAS